MYYVIKGKLHDVKEKSREILALREEKFTTMIRKAETHFLELHAVSAVDPQEIAGAGPRLYRAPSRVFAQANGGKE